MKVVITGGAGFLGLRLAGAVLRDGVGGVAVDRLVLADRIEAALADPRAEALAGDVVEPAFVDRVIGDDVDIVFHLAAVVSGEAEADFDLGMRVNVDASRLVLEACRRTGRCPRVVFTSSVAVFGPTSTDGIDDRTAVDPRSSYGAEKAIAELLLKDYTRRGFVDGIVLRLPTISVRPGKPNRAASSFASGIIRDPLSGIDAICPVSPETALWLLSPRRAIEALLRAAAIDGDQLDNDRVVNLPGISVTVAQMVAALRHAGGEAAVGRLKWQRDPAIERIVASWPRDWDDSRARRIGFRGDADFAAIVQAFVEDELGVVRA